MGDGKKLKEYLDEKGTNVRRIAKETGISATTLYTIIQKDSNIRFDFALRLANALDIDVNEICSASPFSGAITEEEIYPTLPDGLNGALDASRVKTYLKNSLYPLMYLFGKNSMPDVDNLLTSFYQLDDEARKEVVETIQFKLQYHRDPERAEQVKQIKEWLTKKKTRRNGLPSGLKRMQRAKRKNEEREDFPQKRKLWNMSDRKNSIAVEVWI